MCNCECIEPCRYILSLPLKEMKVPEWLYGLVYIILLRYGILFFFIEKTSKKYNLNLQDEDGLVFELVATIEIII
jgi:hypothetical protein